jgi:hypothetical protein
MTQEKERKKEIIRERKKKHTYKRNPSLSVVSFCAREIIIIPPVVPLLCTCQTQLLSFLANRTIFYIIFKLKENSNANNFLFFIGILHYMNVLIVLYF